MFGPEDGQEEDQGHLDKLFIHILWHRLKDEAHWGTEWKSQDADDVGLGYSREMTNKYGRQKKTMKSNHLDYCRLYIIIYIYMLNTYVYNIYTVYKEVS